MQGSYLPQGTAGLCILQVLSYLATPGAKPIQKLNTGGGQSHLKAIFILRVPMCQCSSLMASQDQAGAKNGHRLTREGKVRVRVH